MGSMIDGGAKQARKDSKLQQAELKKQKQKEDTRALEAKDEVARRQAIAAKGGARASLLAGAETGVSATGAAATAPSLKPTTTAKMGG